MFCAHMLVQFDHTFGYFALLPFLPTRPSPQTNGGATFEKVVLPSAYQASRIIAALPLLSYKRSAYSSFPSPALPPYYLVAQPRSVWDHFMAASAPLAEGASAGEQWNAVPLGILHSIQCAARGPNRRELWLECGEAEGESRRPWASSAVLVRPVRIRRRGQRRRREGRRQRANRGAAAET